MKSTHTVQDFINLMRSFKVPIQPVLKMGNISRIAPYPDKFFWGRDMYDRLFVNVPVTVTYTIGANRVWLPDEDTGIIIHQEFADHHYGFRMNYEENFLSHIDLGYDRTLAMTMLGADDTEHSDLCRLTALLFDLPLTYTDIEDETRQIRLVRRAI